MDYHFLEEREVGQFENKIPAQQQRLKKKKRARAFNYPGMGL